MEEVREQDRLMFEDLRKDFDDGTGQPCETFEDFVNRFESEIEGFHENDEDFNPNDNHIDLDEIWSK